MLSSAVHQPSAYDSSRHAHPCSRFAKQSKALLTVVKVAYVLQVERDQ